MVKASKRQKKPIRPPMSADRFRVVLEYLNDCRTSIDLNDLEDVSALWTFSTQQRQRWNKEILAMRSKLVIPPDRERQRSFQFE